MVEDWTYRPKKALSPPKDTEFIKIIKGIYHISDKSLEELNYQIYNDNTEIIECENFSMYYSKNELNNARITLTYNNKNSAVIIEYIEKYETCPIIHKPHVFNNHNLYYCRWNFYHFHEYYYNPLSKYPKQCILDNMSETFHVHGRIELCDKINWLLLSLIGRYYNDNSVEPDF